MKPSSVITDSEISFEDMRSEFCIAVGNEFGCELDLTNENLPRAHDHAVSEIYDAINAYMFHWLFNVVGEISAEFSLEPYPLDYDVQIIAQALSDANSRKISAAGKPAQHLKLSIADDETVDNLSERVSNTLQAAAESMIKDNGLELSALLSGGDKAR